MKLGHVPKSALVGEDLAVAGKKGDLVEMDVGVADVFKHMNIGIENSESLLQPVRHVQKLVLVKAVNKSYVLPAGLQI